MSRITTEALADLAAERDGLRIAVINAAFALQRIREIADLSPTWWNDPSAELGKAQP